MNDGVLNKPSLPYWGIHGRYRWNATPWKVRRKSSHGRREAEVPELEELNTSPDAWLRRRSIAQPDQHFYTPVPYSRSPTGQVYLFWLKERNSYC